MNLKLLNSLVSCDSVASHEDEVRQVLYEELISYCDDVFCDHLGSIAFHKKGKGPKVMLCAHMDEVGFLVKNITNKGMLEVLPLGSVQAMSQFMQKVHVTTTTHKKYEGILMCENASMQAAEQPYVNVGLNSKREAEELGIQIGDMVTFASLPFQMQDTYASKALDDRIGCYVLANVLKELHEISCECDVYVVFTSSEEVGTRGAQTITQRIDPDFAIALDIGSSKNIGDVTSANHRQLGKGVMLLHYDKGFIPTQRVTTYIKHIASRHTIALQDDMFVGGGTDMDKIHVCKYGKPGITLGIPLHYAHGAYSIVHRLDVENAQRLCFEIIKDFRQEAYLDMISFLGNHSHIRRI